MNIKAKYFVIAVTLFIFLPVTWVILREVKYRAVHGNTPAETAPVADTTKKDSTTVK